MKRAQAQTRTRTESTALWLLRRERISSPARRQFAALAAVVAATAVSGAMPVAAAAAQTLTITPPPSTGSGPQEGILHNTTWSEPGDDHAFSLEVPAEWNTVGGLAMNGSSNFRQWVSTAAPIDDMIVVIGDQGLPPFVVPTADMIKGGYTDGRVLQVNDGKTTIMLSHYMPALEFNRWYADKRLMPVFTDITYGKEREETVLSAEATKAAQKVAGKGEVLTVNIGETAFTGHSKATGNAETGVVVSVVLHSGSTAKGDEAWIARPILFGCAVNDRTARHKALVGTILVGMMQTWKDSPEWAQKYNANQPPKEQSQGSEAPPAQRASLMGTFWRDPQVREASARRFVQFFKDQTP